ATLRKYANIMENEGHVFDRNDKGHRIYSDSDIKMLRDIQTEHKSGKTVEQSIHWVIHQKMGTNVNNDIKYAAMSANDTGELKESVQGLFDKVDEQQKEIEHHQKYINESLTIIDEKLETKKQVDTTDNKDKGLFNRIFKKGK